jgi:hypothetical protein
MPASRSSAGRDATNIGMASVVGVGLNAAKLVMFATLFTASELDLVTAGLLLAVTGAQLCGEPLANLAVIRDGRRIPRRVAWVLPAVFAVGALFPRAVLALAAPGLEASSHALTVTRLFSLAGAAVILMWWAAGEAQRNLDFTGMQAVYLVPNASAVLALCLPVDDRVAAVAVGLAAGSAIAAAWVAARTRRSRVSPGTTALEARTPAVRTPAGRTLAALVALALAAVANLILLRVMGSFLPEGSLGVLYIGASALVLPTMAVGGALGASLLPRWTTGAASGRLARPEFAALLSAGVSAASAAVLVAAFFIARELPSVRENVDPTILSGLATALPIMAAGAALHGVGPVARSYAVANGRVGLMIVLASAGAALVPVAYLIAPTLAGLSAGYALSALPWLAAIPLTRAGAADRRPVETSSAPSSA